MDIREHSFFETAVVVRRTKRRLPENAGVPRRLLHYRAGAEAGLANSATRVVARLEALKQSGFLKQIAHYPVVYQVTGSASPAN